MSRHKKKRDFSGPATDTGVPAPKARMIDMLGPTLAVIGLVLIVGFVILRLFFY